MPALPFDPSFKHQVRDFKLHTPNGRGEQVKNKMGLTNLKNPATLFFGLFHMTCLALWNTEPTLKMEFDITWYNGVNKWHSSATKSILLSSGWEHEARKYSLFTSLCMKIVRIIQTGFHHTLFLLRTEMSSNVAYLYLPPWHLLFRSIKMPLEIYIFKVTEMTFEWMQEDSHWTLKTRKTVEI